MTHDEALTLLRSGQMTVARYKQLAQERGWPLEVYTAAEKLECVRREIAMRRSVYGNRVRDGRMRQSDADREIGLMEAIARDYAAQDDLFQPKPSIGEAKS